MRINKQLLDKVSQQAKESERLRMNYNFHKSLDAKAQRLYNALELGTEFACLSFNGNKMITTSGGGALVCRTPEEAQRMMFFATQARDNAPHYQH